MDLAQQQTADYHSISDHHQRHEHSVQPTHYAEVEVVTLHDPKKQVQELEWASKLSYLMSNR